MSLTRWNCIDCKQDFFAETPHCPKCGNAVRSKSVERITSLFNASETDAELALAVQDGQYPERYAEIKTGLRISDDQMFIGVIVAANRGDYAADGVPAWDGNAIGDALEQRECMMCKKQFYPNDDEWMCPACHAEQWGHQKIEMSPDYDSIAEWNIDKEYQPVHM